MMLVLFLTSAWLMTRPVPAFWVKSFPTQSKFPAKDKGRWQRPKIHRGTVSIWWDTEQILFKKKKKIPGNSDRETESCWQLIKKNSKKASIWHINICILFWHFLQLCSTWNSKQGIWCSFLVNVISYWHSQGPLNTATFKIYRNTLKNPVNNYYLLNKTTSNPYVPRGILIIMLRSLHIREQATAREGEPVAN